MNMLLRRTKFKKSRTAVLGYSSDNLSLFSSRNLFMGGMPSSVPTFGYISMPSDVKSFVPEGKGIFTWSRLFIS